MWYDEESGNIEMTRFAGFAVSCGCSRDEKRTYPRSSFSRLVSVAMKTIVPGGGPLICLPRHLRSAHIFIQGGVFDSSSSSSCCCCCCRLFVCIRTYAYLYDALLVLLCAHTLKMVFFYLRIWNLTTCNCDLFIFFSNFWNLLAYYGDYKLTIA